jgi:hypothetical protein
MCNYAPWLHGRPRDVVAVVLGLGALACQRATASRELHIDQLPALNAVEETRMGDVDDPEVGFSRISQVDIDRDANVYVGEGLDRQIRVYDERGQLLRRIGGRGSGPGEFEGMPRFGVVGDTLWAYDQTARRITLFGRDGTLLGTARAPGVTVSLWSNFGTIMPWSMRPDGRFIGWLSRVGSSRNDPPITTQPTDTMPIPRLLFDAATGTVVDTIGWDPSPPPRLARPPGEDKGRFQSITIGSQRYTVPDPPSTLPLWNPLDDGRIVIEQRVATNAAEGTFVVTRYGYARDDGAARPPMSQTVYTVTFHYAPAAYTETQLDSIAAHSSRRDGVFVNGEPVRVPESEAEVARNQLRAAMKFPPYRQPVSHAWIDQDERVWIHRDDGETPTSRWIILGRDGDVLGQLVLPATLRLHWSRGNELWGALPDELDVPWLVRYRLDLGRGR